MLKPAELEKLYAEMGAEEFAKVFREDLVDAAIPYYDREARRRGFPEPETRVQSGGIRAETLTVPIADTERILREADGRRDARRHDLEMLANQPTSIKGPWNIYTAYRKMVVPAHQRGDKLVVWLRRFHVKRSKSVRFNELLAAACEGLGYPLTVQDSTFRSSYAEAMPLFTPFLFVWGCWVTAELKGWIQPYPVLFLISLFLPFLAMFFLAGRIGYKNLAPKTARERTLRLIDEIRERRGRRGDDSVLVLRCQDSFWRDIVELCLRNASAVVIDVTDVSENVIWELKTALQSLPPECITLACALGYTDRAGLPPEAREVLVAELGADGCNRVRHFFYPQLKDQLRLAQWGTKESLANELRTQLAVGVAYSENRRGVGSANRNL